MKTHDLKTLILKQFPYEANAGQEELIGKFSEFILNNTPNSLFVLKGYAGTGKTTIVSSLVNVLPSINKKSVLLAPTGRAAKVLSNYSSKQAFTIHKKIYKLHTSPDGGTSLIPQKNYHKNTVFIVDEASMIPAGSNLLSSSLFNDRDLLSDLLEYVYESDNCKLILIGDTAQLPPVGISVSPALDISFLEKNYDLDIDFYELTDVVRQAQESGILANATRIRKQIKSQQTDSPLFSLNNCDDIIRIDSSELEDALNGMYSRYGSENTIVICRTNKQANIFNREVRNRILYKENEIEAGDYMMIVKNNYFWLPSTSEAGFIANGDIVELLRINRYEELYGFRFADVTIRMIDYPEQKEFDVKIILDTIMAETPALTSEQNKSLYNNVMEDYADVPQRKQRYLKMKSNPFFNALQVKFAYALTCHKTQGGQWDAVFVFKGFFPNKKIDTEYQRWLYTAITRTTKQTYLVNFDDEFFS